MSGRRYAQNTDVTASRSRAELEDLLARFGADQFFSGWDSEQQAAFVGFRITDRMVRLVLPMPDPNDPDITRTPTGRPRSRSQVELEYAKEQRRRWRSLVAVVKAKLVAVEDGISTIEREFLADVLLPDGRTLGEYVAPQLDDVYGNGGMPALLPGVVGALSAGTADGEIIEEGDDE